MELKLTQSSLPIVIFNSSSFLLKHSSLLAQKWKIDIQRISWNCERVGKKILVHVVKHGETLSLISKLYGVSIVEIAAANKEIADVLEGQHLSIPSAIAGDAQLCQSEGNKLQECKASPNIRFLGRQWNQIFTVESSHRLPLAKNAASFLLVVPLIAFCIGCIMGAFQNIVTRNLKRQAANEPELHRHRSNGGRWKTALSELRDPDSFDTESETQHSDASSEEEQEQEQEQSDFDDISSRDYTKLEGDYQKFLAECGMSNWGYWRGGS